MVPSPLRDRRIASVRRRKAAVRLVRLAALTRLEAYAKGSHVAILADGSRIPVSREGHARLRALLG
jgi:hypothetical protein